MGAVVGRHGENSFKDSGRFSVGGVYDSANRRAVQAASARQGFAVAPARRFIDTAADFVENEQGC